MIVVVASVACTPGPDAEPAPGSTSATSTTSVGSTAALATTALDTTTASSTTSTSATDDDDGGTFILPNDWGGSTFECDTFAQDCPPGQKCNVYASERGAAWDGTRCVQVVRDPAGVGEPCSVFDHAASGLDTCDVDGMCWLLDEELEGTCMAYCQGAAHAPECAEGFFCPISAAGVFNVCFPECDPLASTCDEDAVCVPLVGPFGCAPADAPPDATHGSPCAFINGCPAGMVCVGADAHSACTRSIGCCSTVCDVTSDKDPCPDLDPGQSCEAWYSRGAAPEGLEHVGVCALPV